MQKMGEEAQANAEAARAKTAHTLAQADKANAETIKTMMEVQQQQKHANGTNLTNVVGYARLTAAEPATNRGEC